MRIITLLLNLIVASACFAQSGALTDYVSLKKGIQAYDFPRSKFPAFSFAVIEPGFPVVPLEGGVYVAGFGWWLAKPQVPLIVSMAQCEKDPDSTILVVKNDATKKKTLLQKVTGLGKEGKVRSSLTLPYGVYDIVSVDNSVCYLYGVDSLGFHLYQSDFSGLYPIFHSNERINDVDLVNENNVLLAIDSSVVLVGLQQAPKNLIKLDVPVDGVARENDGTLYVSTPQGILHFSSLEDGDFDVITSEIHGNLQIRNGRLFVLWGEHFKVVEIKLR